MIEFMIAVAVLTFAVLLGLWIRDLLMTYFPLPQAELKYGLDVL